MAKSEFGSLPSFVLSLSIYVGQLSSLRASNSHQAVLLPSSGEIPGRLLQCAPVIMACRRDRSDRECFNLIYPRHVEHLKVKKPIGAQNVSLTNWRMPSKARGDCHGRSVLMAIVQKRSNLDCHCRGFYKIPSVMPFKQIFPIAERDSVGRREHEQKPTDLATKRVGHSPG